MSQFDSEILKQMQGLPAKTDASPAHPTPVNEVAAATAADSSGGSEITADDASFLADQAVRPATDLESVSQQSGMLKLTDAQLARHNTPPNSDMSDDDKDFWAIRSGLASTQTSSRPASDATAAPDQKPGLKDVLGTAREHGREIKGEGSVFDRLIRAKDRVKASMSKVTGVLIEKGHVITGKVDAAHDLYVGLRDDADIRRQVADIAVDATREVVDVPFAIAGETLEKMLTVKIRIGDKEYVPIDEMIKTAEAVESSIINTKNSAIELAHMTARGIKNRIQDTIDVARIARNLTLAKLVEDRKRDRETMQKRIESAENGVWLAQEILRKVERGIDRVRTKGDTPEHLQSVAMAKRQEAFGILGSLIARKDAIFGIRQMAETPKTQVIEPQVEAVQEPEGPITGSKDPRFRSLSNFEQQVIFDREEREAKEAPQSELHVNNPRSLSNTIL